MNTEITQTPVNNARRGQVFYDADCSLCRRLAGRWSPVFGRRGYLFQPLQSASNLGPGAPAPAQFMEEMQLRRTDGRWLGGVAVWIELGRSVGWLQPLAPWLGTAGATLVVFLISGGLHELAITVPAGAGFGGPTVCFLLPALGLLAERHPWLRNRPVRRRLWAWVLAAAPVPFLFPPVFIERVILPLLDALGAR